MANTTEILPAADIAPRIRLVRETRVILDTDLAGNYGVATKRLNEQFRRNRERFPQDFAFRLTQDEWKSLRSQFATLNPADMRSQIATASKRKCGTFRMLSQNTAL